MEVGVNGLFARIGVVLNVVLWVMQCMLRS